MGTGLVVAVLVFLGGCGDLHARLRAPAHAATRADRPAPVRPLAIGRSVKGRLIHGWQVGDPGSRRRVLVVGCVHGNEPAGEAITHRLRSAQPPPGTSLLIVDAFNPDGCAAGTRQNAHGVDLNRNSPSHWQHLDQPGGTYYSGPRPLSEPESRAIVRFVRRFRPSISIWYHQHARLVDASGGDPRIERAYAHLVGLPFRHLGVIPGSITSWQNATFSSDTAFVVELPAGRLSSRSADRHVAAVLSLAGR
jgi:protein MpaA